MVRLQNNKRSKDVLGAEDSGKTYAHIIDTAAHDVAMVGKIWTMRFARTGHVHIHLSFRSTAVSTILGHGIIVVKESTLFFHLNGVIASVGSPQYAPEQGDDGIQVRLRDHELL